MSAGPGDGELSLAREVAARRLAAEVGRRWQVVGRPAPRESPTIP